MVDAQIDLRQLILIGERLWTEGESAAVATFRQHLEEIRNSLTIEPESPDCSSIGEKLALLGALAPAFLMTGNAAVWKMPSDLQ